MKFVKKEQITIRQLVVFWVSRLFWNDLYLVMGVSERLAKGINI